MTVIDEHQFTLLKDELEHIAGEVSQLSRVCDALCSCMGGINYAINAQTDAIKELTNQIVQPLQQMRDNISEIRDGVDEIR